MCYLGNCWSHFNPFIIHIEEVPYVECIPLLTFWGDLRFLCNLRHPVLFLVGESKVVFPHTSLDRKNTNISKIKILSISRQHKSWHHRFSPTTLIWQILRQRLTTATLFHTDFSSVFILSSVSSFKMIFLNVLCTVTSILKLFYSTTGKPL